MKKAGFYTSAVGVSAALLLVVAWRGGAQNGPPPTTSTILGQALPGLTDIELSAFKDGLKSFVTTEVRADGLGPVFNGTSCAECHKAGAIGGAGLDVSIARVTRIGSMGNGGYSDLEQFGGPVLQARSLKEFDTSCPISGEVVPPQAQFVSLRITTPLFGLGLMEAIPDAAILARVGRPDPDGVQGVPNLVFNPETGKTELGRFGWKSQHSTIHLFSGDAYLNEMGITSASFPKENLPQGRPIPAGWDSVADPEDQDNDAEAFTNYMRLLAPAGRRLPITPQVAAGEGVFNQIRCASCHTPEMRTGPNNIAALSNQSVKLYSDLLLHRMGKSLADGIQQGQAKGDMFRTAPLWGLSRRVFFLHDGRARSIEDAVAMHDGEASAARNRYYGLRRQDRDSLLAFLYSL
ncbi:MAG: di-heme oxidoredictase family protein [Chthonomonadales bacterium]